MAPAPPVAAAVPAKPTRGATAAPPAPPATPERDPAADLTPEDLVLKEEPKRREKTRRAGARRNKRHGRSR